MVSPWRSLAAEAKAQEPCWLSGALRALSVLPPLLATLLPVLWVQPCKLFIVLAKRSRTRLSLLQPGCSQVRELDFPKRFS